MPLHAHTVKAAQATYRLTAEGVHIAYPASEEWIIPWDEILDVVANVSDSGPSGIVRYFSFGTVYGRELEIHDGDHGWSQILEQLPNFVPCVTSTVELLSASDSPRTLWSRQPN